MAQGSGLAQDLTVEQLLDYIARFAPPQNAIQFARNSNDELLVGAVAGALPGIQWGNASAEPTYYGSGAPNSMDMREMQALESEENFNMVRTQRWK